MRKLHNHSYFLNQVKESADGIHTKPLPNHMVEAVVSEIERSVLSHLGLVLNESAYLVGGAGKRATDNELCSDIDLAVHVQRDSLKGFTLDGKMKEYRDRLRARYSDVKYDSVNKAVVFPYPVSLTGDHVRVELHGTHNPEYAKFYQYCPDYRMSESVYTGQHRTDFLSRIISSNCRVSEFFTMDDFNGKYVNESKTVNRFVLCPDGLYEKTLSYLGARGRLSKPYEVKRTFITDEPKHIILEFFGEGYTEKDFNSFESIFEIVSQENSRYKQVLNEIGRDFSNSILIRSKGIPDQILKLEGNI